MPAPGFLRRWLAWVLVTLALASALTWYFTRDRLPSEIRIATGAAGGLYHKFGTLLARYLQDRTGLPVRAVETQGSTENRELLLSGRVELAVIQAGSVSVDGLAALTPLFQDVVHVVARKGRGIQALGDLRGKRVSLGPARSGMRASALQVLAHHGLSPENLNATEDYFGRLAADPALDAAMVTTGLLNPDLGKLMASGEFLLVPILDANALAVWYPFFYPAHVPLGLYAGDPPIPDQDAPTVATTAFLSASTKTSALLVNAALQALYERYPRDEIPTLIPRPQARVWEGVALHPAARAYFEPYEGIGILSDFMQSLAAIKELLFAFGAVLYLFWDRRRRVLETESRKEGHVQKERLDVLLAESARIEKAQMTETDPEVLRKLLDEVTLIKLKGLEELTDEALRGDRLFSIFLTQCANLIQRIQTKIIYRSQLRAGTSVPPKPPPSGAPST